MLCSDLMEKAGYIMDPAAHPKLNSTAPRAIWCSTSGQSWHRALYYAVKSFFHKQLCFCKKQCCCNPYKLGRIAMSYIATLSYGGNRPSLLAQAAGGLNNLSDDYRRCNRCGGQWFRTDGSWDRHNGICKPCRDEDLMSRYR